MTKLKCPVCGKIFERRGNNQTWCSIACRNIARAYQRSQKRKAEHRQREFDKWRELSLAPREVPFVERLLIDCEGLNQKLIRELVDLLSPHFAKVKIFGEFIKVCKPLSEENFNAATKIINLFGVNVKESRK